ncbi:STAS domain-containing protein [Streptomyces sp. NPDC052225]|uniref:STAS domain-containing protein n=1 Tax=Streptomyces sp. NPDC052225 TaxID=3154949 RepID=UPI003412DF46
MNPAAAGYIPDDAPEPAHGTLDVATAAGPTGPVVSLSGDLDYESGPELLTAVNALSAPAGSTVTLDLSGVRFFDSGGINALLRARSRLQERGAELRVRRLSPVVERIFRITGLDAVLAPDAPHPYGGDEDPAAG